MFDVAREVASRYGYSIEPGEREFTTEQREN